MFLNNQLCVTTKITNFESVNREVMKKWRNADCVKTTFTIKAQKEKLRKALK